MKPDITGENNINSHTDIEAWIALKLTNTDISGHISHLLSELIERSDDKRQRCTRVSWYVLEEYGSNGTCIGIHSMP